MDNINNVALVVTTCDSYCDVMKHFFPILKLFWNDYNLQSYVITETNNINYDNKSKTILGGREITWSERLRNALLQIKEDYIFFFMDDYFFGKKIDNPYITKIIDFMNEKDILYFDMRNHNKTTKKISSKIGLISKKNDYPISLQAAIWKKKYLLSFLEGKCCNAWEIENMLIKYCDDLDCKYIANCVCDLSNPLNIQNGVIKGKWLPSVIRFYKKIGYEIDYSKRGLLPFKSILRQNVFTFFARMMPKKMKRFLKKILKKIGFKFVTD